MNIGSQKAHDLASEVMKQITTLATGTVAITVSFASDLAPRATPYLFVLGAAWTLLLLSVVAALFTLMCLAGNLEKQAEPSIYSGNTVFLASAAIVLFVAGIGTLICFASLALGRAA
jgi:hypothetical protein